MPLLLVRRLMIVPARQPLTYTTGAIGMNLIVVVANIPSITCTGSHSVQTVCDSIIAFLL